MEEDRYSNLSIPSTASALNSGVLSGSGESSWII